MHLWGQPYSLEWRFNGPILHIIPCLQTFLLGDVEIVPSVPVCTVEIYFHAPLGKTLFPTAGVKPFLNVSALQLQTLLL